MKTCTKCKIEKPFEDFNKNKASKDGYHSRCKECCKTRDVELKKSPLLQLEKQVKSSIILENKLLAREGKKLCGICKDIFLIDDLNSQGYCENCYTEYSREYYKKNKDKFIKRDREYRIKNKDKLSEYRLKNEDKIKEYQKEYRLENKDKRKEYQKEYYLKNKDQFKERDREYRLKKKLEKENKTDVTS